MLTEEQKKAIRSRKKDIVISASAGSGKTSTMVSRVIALIKGGVKPERIAMMTFTENAAREMISRLSDALIKEIRLVPLSERKVLVDALDALPMISCGTIHSFCYKFIMSHFEKVSLSPMHSIIDEKGADSLKNRAFRAVTRDHYLREGADYVSFAAHFDKIADENLKKSVFKVYALLTTLDEEEDFLAKWEKIAETELSEQAGAALFTEYYRKKAERLIAKYAERHVEAANVGAEEIKAQIEYRIKKLQAAYLVRDFEEIFHVQDERDYGKMPSVSRREKTDFALLWEDVEALDKARKALEDDLKERVKEFGTYDEACEAHRDSSLRVKKLLSLVRDFAAEYEKVKQETKVLDFADLEKYALRLLSDDEIRKGLLFEHVLVDESQDINPVQEKLICLLSEKRARFSVGDVKQSIYRFRLADPNIFLRAMERAAASPEKSDLILFNQNFRSSKAVVDFVNDVFDPLMRPSFGGVDYGAAHLIGQENGNSGEVRCFFCRKEIPAPTVIDKMYDLPEAVRLAKERDSENEEVKWVRDRIRRLVGTKLYDAKKGEEFIVRYGDIAVLSVSRGRVAQELISCLQKSNIPVNVGAFEREGKCLEGEQLTDLLRLVLSPHDDYALLSVMRSPMFEFSMEEIIRISLLEGESFYEKAAAYAEKPEGEKMRELFAYVEKVRFESSVFPLADLMSRVAEERFRLPLLREPDGRLRFGKLRAFVSAMASRSEITSVASFLDYHDQDYDGAAGGEIADGNAVTFMTVHGSKGLEFPIVFLVDTGAEIVSSQDAKESVLADRDLGVHLRVTELGGVERKCASFRMTLVKKKLEAMEDKLRLLYVALTRARNSLYVTGKIADAKFGKILSPESGSSMAEWITYAVPEPPHLERHYEERPFIASPKQEEKERVEVDKESLRKAFAYEYPHKKATVTGIKYTVTGINSMDEEGYHPPTPLFPEEKVERGTALHALMEHIPLSSEKEEDVALCLCELVRQGIVSEEEGREVSPAVVLEALSVIRALVGDRKVEREKTFMLKLPARAVGVADLDDEVAVQGKLDLLALGEDAVIVDYKVSGAPIPVLKERYKAQLELYALAVKKSLAVSSVRKYIFVPGRNLLIEI